MYGGNPLKTEAVYKGIFDKEPLNKGILDKGMLYFPNDFLTDKNECGLGIAFDIGTTTIVAILWDLSNGNLLGTSTIANPQSNHGRDVIARITYAQRRPDGLEILNKSLIKGIAELKENLFAQHPASNERIKKIVFAGNTTMAHILLNKNPEGLGVAPFEPEYAGAFTITGDYFGFDKEIDSYVISSIAGHVGGDITAGVLSSRLLEQKGIHLFIDLGTNGEIVLARGGEALTCSTAAGPAFEGASLNCGMRAVIGAITGIDIAKKIGITTIGNQEPLGICGSGVVSVVAEMLRVGIINSRGRITTRKIWEDQNPDSRIGEMLTQEEKERVFCLVLAKEEKKEIKISQGDVREVQLAKAAIRGGLQVLLREWGLEESDLDGIHIGGAFGSTLNKMDAIAIGLIPDMELDKIHILGNSAGAGASMVLLSKREKTLAEEIPDKVRHLELALRDDFQEAYIMAMDF